MMKKLIAIGIVILAFVGIYRFFQKPEMTVKHEAAKPTQAMPSSTAPKNSARSLAVQKALFIPYWNPAIDDTTKSAYDTFVYFGVAADGEGNIKSDTGFENIGTFQQSTSGKKQLLTVRMLDTDINHAILEDEDKQQVLIREVLSIVRNNDFDGVVLDLEMSALPLTDVRNNITLFMQRMGEVVQDENKHFAITMYGDVYYRARPYDVKAIGNIVDEVMIMTYDFHKSRGEPGPNFPFTGQETYGYDFQMMIEDFTKDVPAGKLTILLGMYGYDWTLGPQGKPLKGAKALPLSDIQEMTQPSCSLTKCQVSRDKYTKETKVSYIDDENYRHELWFEDEQSADVKIEYLEEQGIDSVGYWVYGYF